jgi:hypothetical protein
MLWSPVALPGRPTLLVVDASGNAGGWEAEFCDRLFESMRRRKLHLHGDAPVRVQAPGELARHLEPPDACNCLLLFSRGDQGSDAAGTGLRSYWEWLEAHPPASPKLFASCAWEAYDPELSRRILGDRRDFAPIVLTQESPLTPREAGLFFLKLFTELDLHCPESITGKMVWFSYIKTRELLKRRQLPGRVGVRC